jgi:O-acetyl-ADP-ribose deacetylase (regulator of RNase III)
MIFNILIYNTTLENKKKMSIQIKVIKENVTNVQCDILVNSCHPSLENGGGIHGAIRKAAGFPFAESCKCFMQGRGYIPLAPGEKMLTSGSGSLKAAHILNIAAPTTFSPEVLKLAYRHVFVEACQKKAKTVVMPMFSTGVYGMKTNESFKAFIDCFREMSGYITHDLTIAIITNDDSQFSELMFLVKHT